MPSLAMTSQGHCVRCLDANRHHHCVTFETALIPLLGSGLTKPCLYWMLHTKTSLNKCDSNIISLRNVILLHFPPLHTSFLMTHSPHHTSICSRYINTVDIILQCTFT